MQELVERGHIYIAVASLNRVKISGSHEQYVEKESHFEEILVRERIKDMVVRDRAGSEQALTEARWNRFTRVLTEFEGWSSRLRSDFGAAATDFVIQHRLVETPAATLAEVEAALASLEPNGYDVSVLEMTADSFNARVVEHETSAATSSNVPAELLASPVYANVRKAHALSPRSSGAPPFRLRLGDEGPARPRPSRALREQLARRLRRKACSPGRFKGLGEMDPDRALGHDDGSGEARARPGRGRGRSSSRPDLLDADGRPGRAAPRLHRAEREVTSRFLDV